MTSRHKKKAIRTYTTVPSIRGPTQDVEVVLVPLTCPWPHFDGSNNVRRTSKKSRGSYRVATPLLVFFFFFLNVGFLENQVKGLSPLHDAKKLFAMIPTDIGRSRWSRTHGIEDDVYCAARGPLLVLSTTVSVRDKRTWPRRVRSHDFSLHAWISRLPRSFVSLTKLTAL